jgi:hypothetical protein
MVRAVDSDQQPPDQREQLPEARARALVEREFNYPGQTICQLITPWYKGHGGGRARHRVIGERVS